MSAARGYRAVIFDLFRTVVFLTAEAPTGQVHEPTWRSAMRALQPEFETLLPVAQIEPFFDALVAASDDIARARPPEYREVPIGDRYQRALGRIGYAAPDAARLADRLAAIQLAAQVAGTALPADHAALLERLAARYRLGLISNFDHAPAAREVLARHGLDRRFASVVISIEVGRRKPHAEVFDLALRDLGVEPAEALFVGDSPREDIGGAAAVGLHTAWLNIRGRPWPPGLAAPAFTLRQLTDLEEFL